MSEIEQEYPRAAVHEIPTVLSALAARAEGWASAAATSDMNNGEDAWKRAALEASGMLCAFPMLLMNGLYLALSLPILVNAEIRRLIAAEAEADLPGYATRLFTEITNDPYFSLTGEQMKYLDRVQSEVSDLPEQCFCIAALMAGSAAQYDVLVAAVRRLGLPEPPLTRDALVALRDSTRIAEVIVGELGRSGRSTLHDRPVIIAHDLVYIGLGPFIPHD